jgi:sortase A
VLAAEPTDESAGDRRLRHWRLACAVLTTALVVAGTWHLGHGLWIPVKARLAQYLLHRAWALTLAGHARVKPWPWADTWPVARLHVPAHGVDLIVLDGVSGRTLAFGPGHAPASALPGAPGTAIVTGHRDTHFRFLRKVEPGEEIVVEVPGRPPSRFRVMETAVIDSRTAVITDAAPSAALVLLTCYPFDAVVPGGPLRYAVTAVAETRPGLWSTCRHSLTPDRPSPSIASASSMCGLHLDDHQSLRQRVVPIAE